MNNAEILTWIFGPVLITALAAGVTFVTNFLNLRDRFLKWRKERKISIQEKKLNLKDAEAPEKKENFIFKIGFISNSAPGKCILTISIINKSGEVKFVDPLSYNFQFKQTPNIYQPATMVMSNENWPRRLEHGERFATTTEFHLILNNNLFQYWKRDVLVFATTRTTIGDELKSNSIEYDKLAENLIPLIEEFKNLAKEISEKLNGYYIDVYVSLWQLQIFNRLTTHIAKQLNDCGIPMLDFLISDHKLTFEKYPWGEWYRPLEEKKIPPSEIVKFLQDFIRNREN
ncbi:MAG: hypothetical protein PSV36_05925 [Algoriphagus sp.]|nr:hypothetical protein [Algoriphagus sp.]